MLVRRKTDKWDRESDPNAYSLEETREIMQDPEFKIYLRSLVDGAMGEKSSLTKEMSKKLRQTFDISVVAKRETTLEPDLVSLRNWDDMRDIVDATGLDVGGPRPLNNFAFDKEGKVVIYDTELSATSSEVFGYAIYQKGYFTEAAHKRFEVDFEIE